MTHSLGRILAASAVCAIFFVAGCGGDSAYVPDPAKLFEDTAKSLTYPAGPYGKDVGSVADNHSFQVSFYDPFFSCKSMKDQKLDGALGTRTITFEDLYKGSALCVDKPVKLAFFAITAGYCGTCQSELKTLAQKAAAGEIDSRVIFINAVIATTVQTEKPDANFLWNAVSSYNMNFPQIADTSRTLRGYFTESSIPMNLGIDLTTMKVVYKKVGFSYSTIDSFIKQHLGY